MPQTGEPKKRPKGRNPLIDLLTPKEAADEKGVSVRAVTKAIQSGSLGAWSKRTLHLIPRRELVEWQPQRRAARARQLESKDE